MAKFRKKALLFAANLFLPAVSAFAASEDLQKIEVEFASGSIQNTQSRFLEAEQLLVYEAVKLCGSLAKIAEINEMNFNIAPGCPSLKYAGWILLREDGCYNETIFDTYLGCYPMVRASLKVRCSE